MTYFLVFDGLNNRIKAHHHLSYPSLLREGARPYGYREVRGLTYSLEITKSEQYNQRKTISSTTVLPNWS